MDKRTESRLRNVTLRQAEFATQFKLDDPLTPAEILGLGTAGKTVVYKHLSALASAGAITRLENIPTGGRPTAGYVINLEALPILIDQLESRAARITNALGALRGYEEVVVRIDSTVASLKSLADI